MHKFAIAPMMDYTDRHCRYFFRLISKETLLYTEMVTTGAILHGDCDRHLEFNSEEHPLALQLGGSEPDELAECGRIAQDYGYDEINLNIGCPSDRVQNGRFGACLMAEPNRVARCVAALQDATALLITVKTRIGIDHSDSFEDLHHFISTVAATGCKTFIIHARKAWLNGLNPKQNRRVPPINYERVYAIKQAFPHLNIMINGEIKTLDATLEHLNHVDGVMMGREAFQNPYLLAEVDQKIFNCNHPIPSRLEILENYLAYLLTQTSKKQSLTSLIRPIFGLFQGLNGARAWRRHLSENAHLPTASAHLILECLPS